METFERISLFFSSSDQNDSFRLHEIDSSRNPLLNEINDSRRELAGEVMDTMGSLAMESANDGAPLDGILGKGEGIPEGVDTNFDNTSHAGLNALLDAVTLHISKSDEEQRTDESAVLRCHAKSLRSHDGGQALDTPTTTTPTIVPEVHETPEVTFPLRLMTILMDPENTEVITFLPDGKYFALRVHEFSCKLMKESFHMTDYETFTAELSSWGFSTVETKRPGIKVYRHKLFREGDWILCEQMKQHECYTILPDEDNRQGLQRRSSSLSEDDMSKSEKGLSEGTKRRLSPSSSSASNNGSSSKVCTRASHSSDEESSAINHDVDLRTTALSITTEKLNICETDDREFPLVQHAVAGATHSIVSDAIECLLRDQDHTKHIFQKHAEELSKSVLPGLIPISKQLFSLEEDKASEAEKIDNERSD